MFNYDIKRQITAAFDSKTASLLARNVNLFGESRTRLARGSCVNDVDEPLKGNAAQGIRSRQVSGIEILKLNCDRVETS